MLSIMFGARIMYALPQRTEATLRVLPTILQMQQCTKYEIS